MKRDGPAPGSGGSSGVRAPDVGEESKLVSHMVIFRSGEGKAGYHQADGIDDAIRFVERLRNSENVEQARIFRMEEVGFEYRPYFRVEVAGAGSAPVAEVEPTHEPATVASAVKGDFQPPEPVAEDHEGDEVGVGARRGLFNR